MKTKMLIALSLMISTAGIAPHALADEAGTWLVRSRGIFIAPSATTKALPVDVRTEAVPEFDFSYFVFKNVSLELILGMARHDITLGGGEIGSVNVLPPTLDAQYHFKDLINLPVDPYLGAGLNFTIFYNSNLPVDIKSTSFGPSLQAGIDIPIKGDVFVNIDFKKIWMQTDIMAKGNSAVLDTLKINPWVYGLGIGFKL